MSRKYSAEFKEEAVRLVTGSGYTQAEVSRNLGISDSNINRWVTEHFSERPKQRTKATQEQDELNRLRQENAQLKMEREILKKAAAFFAKESK